MLLVVILFLNKTEKIIRLLLPPSGLKNIFRFLSRSYVKRYLKVTKNRVSEVYCEMLSVDVFPV